MEGGGALTSFPNRAPPPPLWVGQKRSGFLGHEKHPEFGPSNRPTSRRLLFGTLVGRTEALAEDLKQQVELLRADYKEIAKVLRGL